MRSILLRYGLKHHLQHRARLAMVLVALTLGVAIFVSSYESVAAAQTAIFTAAQGVANHVDWEVSRPGRQGIEESMVDRIRREPGAVAAPLIQTTVTTTGSVPEDLVVIGVDLGSDSSLRLLGSGGGIDAAPFLGLLAPDGPRILVAKPFAMRYGLSTGSILTLQGPRGPQAFQGVGVVDDKRISALNGGNVGFMEIHLAAKEFGTPGLVDKIEVAGVSRRELQQICPGCRIEAPGKLSSAAQDALAHVRSLLGVSVIALMVGVLLIYNVVQVSVLERTRDLAVLRSIGATRIQLLTLLLAEWTVIGLAGSCAGLAVGSLLASGLLDYTKRTVNSMVPLITDASVSVAPALVAATLAIGTGVALVAAFVPAWAAARVRPLDVLRPYSYRAVHPYWKSAVIGAVLFVTANVLLAVIPMSYMIGLAITGFEFLGIALLFPQVILLAGGWLRRKIRAGGSAGPYLAFNGLLQAPVRTAFTMMTFGCALMLLVAAKTMVQGFRVSVGAWINAAFPFDISVMGNDMASSAYGSQALPAGIADRLRGLPGVHDVYSVRKVFTPFRGADIMALGLESDRFFAGRRAKSMPIWPPELSDPRSMAAFKDGTGAFVSNNFAALFGVHPGSRLTLDTPTGSTQFRVLGQIDDYSWTHGVVIMDLATLRRDWRDRFVSYVDVCIGPGWSVPQVKTEVRRVAAGDREAFVYSKAEIMQATDSILDQAVSMANVQALIALIVGVLGVVNSVWIGVMNRKREIALWRAIGVTRGNVACIVLYEGVFIAVVAAVLGTLGGLFGGWVPLRQLSFEVTGYLYPLSVPWGYLGLEILAALLLGLVAGWLPSRLAAALPVLENIAYE